MRAPLPLLMLALLAPLAGCQDPAPAPGVWNPAKSAEELVIAELSLGARHLTAGERFELSLAVPAAGSGTLTHYGFKHRMGEQLTAIRPALPVVNGGRLRMWVGPLTNVTEAGPLALELWLVDSAGRESNRLAGELVIQ